LTGPSIFRSSSVTVPSGLGLFPVLRLDLQTLVEGVARSVADDAKLVQGVVSPNVSMQFGTSVSNVIDFFAIFTDNGPSPDAFCQGVAKSSTHGALSGGGN
jgi:hypothetical protein